MDEIISFKTEILEHRNKILITKEQELQKSIDSVLKDISALEQVRSNFYIKLEEKGALESIKNTYELLTREKTVLAGNLKILEEVDSLHEKMGNLQVSISETKNNILSILRQRKHTIETLQELFLEILQCAIVLEGDSANGYFAISENPASPKNQLPFKIEIGISKADALGLSRLKIVAYDLMVFLHNVKLKRTMPDFIIHDGVFHGISLDTKINALNFIYRQYLENQSFQYITTFNEDEISIPDDISEAVGKFDFQLSDVVIAMYTDEPDDMIFKRNFK